MVFFKRKKFDLSYLYHGKHAQQADENDRFVAIYNAGISSRLLGEYHRAAAEFEQALEISVPRNVSIFLLSISKELTFCCFRIWRACLCAMDN